jgi:DNA invertase Pin-like site-specific DNA recombinase
MRSAHQSAATSSSTPGKALAYVTDAADRTAIADACPALGLELAEVLREAPDGDERPELARGLDALTGGRADCLIVRRLSDLGRRGDGLERVLDHIDTADLRLVALDVGLDTHARSGLLALARTPAEGRSWVLPGEEEPEAEAAAAEAAEAEAETEAEAAATVGAAAAETAEAPPAVAPPREPAAEPPAAPAAAPTVALGYASAADAGENAAQELAAQRASIEARCAAAGVTLAEIVGDREPKDGKAMDRPGLSHALQRIAAGEASCLVVDGLARVSRSVAELGRLVRWLEERDVRLIAIDLEIDTATPAGRTAARALASVGDWERDRLSERTRAGLAAARAKRHGATGARAEAEAALRRRIAALRADGMTLQAIADLLNEEGVPTQRGGVKWRPSSVQSAAGYKRPQRARSADGLNAGPPKS